MCFYTKGRATGHPRGLEIAILYWRVSCSLAATTSVWTAEDAVKLPLAGADVTMMASPCCGTGPSNPGVVLEACGRGWTSTSARASSSSKAA